MKKILSLISLTVIIMGGCAADRNNPFDPGADNYAGTSGQTPAPAVTVTVTFDSDGGTSIDSQQVAEGGLIVEPEDPVRSGFAFTGWFTEPECQNLWNFSTGTVFADRTLFAGWIVQITYTVTFDSDGGTSIDSQQVAEGGLIVEPEDPAYGSYLFYGWLTESSDPWNFDTDTVTSDMTLIAQWVDVHPGPDPVTITFNSMGGSDVDPVMVMPYDPVSQPADPFRSGYLFTGWFTEEECINYWNFNDPVNDERTFYAGWVPE